MDKLKLYKLSPELNDGDHTCIIENPKEVVDAVKNHLECGPALGDRFTVEVVEMTREEFESLPEI